MVYNIINKKKETIVKYVFSSAGGDRIYNGFTQTLEREINLLFERMESPNNFPMSKEKKTK